MIVQTAKVFVLYIGKFAECFYCLVNRLFLRYLEFSGSSKSLLQPEHFIDIVKLSRWLRWFYNLVIIARYTEWFSLYCLWTGCSSVFWLSSVQRTGHSSDDIILGCLIKKQKLATLHNTFKVEFYSCITKKICVENLQRKCWFPCFSCRDHQMLVV